MFRFRAALTFLISGLLVTGAFADTGSQPSLVSGGLLPFLGACFVGGLLALLTPCVFPMVPVTVSYFSKRTHKPVLSAIAYSLGIVGTFAILGVTVAALFGATKIQAFATNPWVNLSLGILFVVLALNLFGVYEFQVPGANQMASASRKSKNELVTPVLMAIAFTLTSFTCTAPIVGTLLVLSAKGGNLTYPFLGMASFGVAFAIPFFLLALFPSYVSKLPKGGDWLGTVKPTLGFIELMAAMKFFSNADLGWQWGLLTRTNFIVSWSVLLLAMAIYLGLSKSAGWVRRGFAVAVFGAAAWMAFGITKKDLGELNSFLPPTPYPYKGQLATAFTEPKNSKEDLGSAKTYKEAIALAKERKATVFIDFTGQYCVNCRKMEQNIFPVAEVAGELKKFVKVQLYTDRDTPDDNANQALEQKLGNTVALPLYVLVKPDGTVIDKFEGLAAQASDFVSFLKKGSS